MLSSCQCESSPGSFDECITAPYDFIFVFRCNYGGPIFYRFRNKARYWSKNANFSYPFVFNLHGPLQLYVVYSSRNTFVIFDPTQPNPRVDMDNSGMHASYNVLLVFDNSWYAKSPQKRWGVPRVVKALHSLTWSKEFLLKGITYCRVISLSVRNKPLLWET